MKLNKVQKEILKSMKKDIKMVFFVRTDLKMGKGKIGSQIGHSSIGLYKIMLKDKNNLIEDWENNGSKKITLKVKGESDFSDIIKYCQINEISYYQVIDAGKTQISPNSKTVISIIGEQKKLNNLIRNYKLL